MATLSLISGNCGRGKGEDQSSGLGQYWHFSNEFLAVDVHGRSIRSLNSVGSNGFKASRLVRGKKFRVVAGVRKGKKHDYPWPDDIDPNSNAPLAYLSYFKPLEEKPKPVTLAFEKPLIDLEQKIIEVVTFLFSFVFFKLLD